MKSNHEEYRGMRVTVMGLGRFGGGVGAARFLAENGATVTVTDLKSERELSESVNSLQGLGINFVLGYHRMGDFTDANMVVVNPAVSRDSEYILKARKRGSILRTEIGLFIEQCPAIVCGVTGSNGKTTTVSMLQSILSASGKPHWIGGNIGGSLLSDLYHISPDDIVVLELSSFQLEWLNEISWSPHIAVVLNVMPNHLDRHGTFSRYLNIKGSILDHQKSSEKAILVRDDPGSRSLLDRARGHVMWVGTNLTIPGITLNEGKIAEQKRRDIFPIMDISRISVPGKHMVINAMAASACARIMGIDHKTIADGIASFKGLPHRLELVGKCGGVTFYNDSKATTPEAAAAAVDSFDNPVILILGGSDKGVSFNEMAHRIAGRIRWAAVLGETAQAIAKALEDAGIAYSLYNSFAEAFNACVTHAKEGDTVLLSPGCASYDMFANYEERGDLFRNLVQECIKSNTK